MFMQVTVVTCNELQLNDVLQKEKGSCAAVHGSRGVLTCVGTCCRLCNVRPALLVRWLENVVGKE